MLRHSTTTRDLRDGYCSIVLNSHKNVSSIHITCFHVPWTWPVDRTRTVCTEIYNQIRRRIILSQIVHYLGLHSKTKGHSNLLWSPYVIGQTIIFLPCNFYLLLLLLFYSSPNLSRRRLDVYHTSTHGVALARI